MTKFATMNTNLKEIIVGKYFYFFKAATLQIFKTNQSPESIQKFVTDFSSWKYYI